MEAFTKHNESKKRPRDESSHGPCSPEPKLYRVDSVADSVHEHPERVDSVTDTTESNRVDPADNLSVRVDPPSHTESFHDSQVAEYFKLNKADWAHDHAESERVDSVTDTTTESYRVDSVDSDRVDLVGEQLVEEILHILEDTNIDSSIHGLDSVIKSFESELTTPFPAQDSGELDYLLGASDDELGLPPAKSNTTPENKSTESVTSPCENVELNEDFAFVDELPVYDSAELRLGEDNYDRNEFVTLGNGLFDYSETPDYLWHSESLTAL